MLYVFVSKQTLIEMRLSIQVRVRVCSHLCLLVPIAQVEYDHVYDHVYSTVCKETKTSDEQVMSENGRTEEEGEGVYTLATEVKEDMDSP